MAAEFNGGCLRAKSRRSRYGVGSSSSFCRLALTRSNVGGLWERMLKMALAQYLAGGADNVAEGIAVVVRGFSSFSWGWQLRKLGIQYHTMTTINTFICNHRVVIAAMSAVVATAGYIGTRTLARTCRRAPLTSLPRSCAIRPLIQNKGKSVSNKLWGLEKPCMLLPWT